MSFLLTLLMPLLLRLLEALLAKQARGEKLTAREVEKLDAFNSKARHLQVVSMQMGCRFPD